MMVQSGLRSCHGCSDSTWEMFALIRPIQGGEKLERRPLPPALGLPATYLAYNARFQVYIALLFYLLLVQGGAKKIKQPHCRSQAAACILRCCLLSERQERWSFLACSCDHCMQRIRVDRVKQVAEDQSYAKRRHHLLRGDDIHHMLDDR